MKVLFVTIAWPASGSSNLYSDLMEEFAENGHDVFVATGSPDIPRGPGICGIENGMTVLRVKTGNIRKTSPVKKAWSLLMLGGQLKRGILRHFAQQQFDLILFNSPPITLSRLLAYMKMKYKCPLYLLLKDIWPYGFVDFGLIKENGLIYNYFRNQEKRLYHLADAIGCMSPKGRDFLLQKHPELNEDKVGICPNSIKIRPGNNRRNGAGSIRKKYGIPDDATIFLFSGNLGLGHGLDFLMQAVIALRSYDKAFFFIGGSGTHFNRIKAIYDREKPLNAHLYSYLPDESYQALVAECDVGLILLDQAYTYPQFPSRLLSYFQHRMAVFCAVNDETDIGTIVEANGAGRTVRHGDLNAFTEGIKMMCENRELTRTMGQNGYELLKKEYSVDRSYEAIMGKLFNGVLEM